MIKTYFWSNPYGLQPSPKRDAMFDYLDSIRVTPEEKRIRVGMKVKVAKAKRKPNLDYYYEFGEGEVITNGYETSIGRKYGVQINGHIKGIYRWEILEICR